MQNLAPAHLFKDKQFFTAGVEKFPQIVDVRLKFQYIYFFSIISLTILITLAVLFFNRFHALKQYSKFIEENSLFVNHLYQLRLHVANIESASKGYMLTSDENFLAPVAHQRENIDLILKALNILAEDNREQKDQLRELRTTIIRNLNMMNWNTGRINREDTFGLGRSLQDSKILLDQFNEQSAQLSETRRAEGERFKAIKAQYEQITPSYFQYVLWFAGFITLLTFYYLHREVKMRMRYQEELELKLRELNRSNAELEQFSFVASHDLQEPLRKIRTFNDRLLFTHGNSLSPEAKEMVEKVNTASANMQEMIRDMVGFTDLIQSDDKLGYVDLNRLIEQVKKEFPDFNVNAELTMDDLPVITGYPNQLRVLFRALIDNSLKFSRSGEMIRIRIRYDQVEGDHKAVYHQLTLSDNGIGFHHQFSGKIFGIFQRLHGPHSDYQGRGIGLAMAKRVMINHQGDIHAQSITGKGSSFILRFPQYIPVGQPPTTSPPLT